jgi:SAM-dependent methyltransferase
MSQILTYLEQRIFFPWRFKYLTNLLIPHLKNVTEVLDVGSGDGNLIKYLQSELNTVKFTAIDTYIQPNAVIPIKKYDGKSFPFDNNSFDCVMFNDVLHHTTDPKHIFEEACRVSRKYILLKDHYWKWSWDRFLLKVGDYMGNKPYGIDLPNNFFSIREWAALFNANCLRVEYLYAWRYNVLDIGKQIFLRLKKKK